MGRSRSPRCEQDSNPATAADGRRCRVTRALLLFALCLALPLCAAPLLPVNPGAIPAQAAAQAARVQQMYIAYYGRPGDPGGVDFWAERLAGAGGNWIADIVDAFGTSAEYTQRFGQLGHAALIDNLYQQLFNRTADPAGRAFYVDLLRGTNASGHNPTGRRSTLAQLALDIANGAQQQDRTILEHKIEVAAYFTDRLRTSGRRYQTADIPDAVHLLSRVNAERQSVAAARQQVDVFVGSQGDPLPVVERLESFAAIGSPQGLVVDQQGQVYVQSLSPFADGGLYKFSPDGRRLAHNPRLFGKLHFALHRASGGIVGIERRGQLYYIDPQTLEAEPIWNLSHLNLAPCEVFNILSGQPSMLFMIDPKFGDIALVEQDRDRLDIFLTAQNSVGGFPFVLRLRLTQDGLEPAVILTSIPWPTAIVPPPLDMHPPGLAASAQGQLLTVLPSDVHRGTTPFYLVGFGADFPAAASERPRFLPQTQGRQVASIGMAPSQRGSGIYVATVANGLGCGLGSAVLYVDRGFERVTCLQALPSAGTIDPFAVAAAPGDAYVYIAMTSRNEVYRVKLRWP